MPSAYYVPTPEASLTAVAGRALQCDGCNSFTVRAPLTGSLALERMGYYVDGVQSPALLSGLGIGAGSGRFNRAIARGIYQLPFVAAPTRGSRGLGVDVNFGDPSTLLMIAGGASLLWLLFRGGQATRRAARRGRRRLRRIRESFSA